MHPPFVIANWKMNGCLRDNRALLAGIKPQGFRPSSMTVVICPPFVYLPQLVQLLDGSGMVLGAQDLSDQSQGAYTGEVSAAMLADCGCSYVIVGHSERRIVYGEDDDAIRRKLSLACEAGLCPILCVGETGAQRRAGQARQAVTAQLGVLEAIAGAPCLIAYEPVWAIGAGRACAPEQVAEMHCFIRQRSASLDQKKPIVLYGGSVKPSNVKALFALAEVDGGLIGGASLQADDFLAICKAAQGRI